MVSKIQSGLVPISLIHVDEKLITGTLKEKFKKKIILFRLTKRHMLKAEV